MRQERDGSGDPGPARARLVVLASGSGTNLQALLDASRDPGFPADVIAVGADRDGTGALARAAAAGVPTFVVRPDDFSARPQWDAALRDSIARFRPHWVVSAGFMRILGGQVLAAFPGRILNTHPALLPAFPGTHAVRDALDYGVKITGCSVHLVDAGIDTGPLLAQQAVAVSDDDDEESLHERIKEVERVLLVQVVARLASEGCTIEGRKVSIP